MKPNGLPTAKTFSHQEYKKSVGLKGTAWFDAKGLERSGYCLESRDKWAGNIILPQVAELVKEQRKERHFALHNFVHHCLSSQAMLFNLVGPLIVREDLGPLQAAFIEAGVSWPAGTTKAIFEFEDRNIFNEVKSQPTSIDLVLEGEATPKLYIEAKFVEQEFGGCSVFERGDCSGSNPARTLSSCYLHNKKGRTYWEKLEQLGFLLPVMTEGPICPLANYYQFFREVAFARVNGGEFVLLFDERSPVFYRSVDGADTGLMSFLLTFVPEKHKSHVHAVSIQKVAASIRDSGHHDDWISDFEEKYGL